jgi:recombinational DNA repair ATPase RecF
VSISKLALERFTAFKTLDIDFSPGINVLIGENGSGKTHILKAVYAATVSNWANVFPDYPLARVGKS